MSQPFGTPNTQSGFTLGTAAQPTGGGTTGFTFGAAAAGAGDANKAVTPGLPQAATQPQAKTYGQPFATSSTTLRFGSPASGAPTFGSPQTGFAISQPKSVTPSTNAASVPGGLTFGTPIGTSTGVASQPVNLGFHTPGTQAPGLGPGSLAAPTTAPGFNFGANPTTTTSALAFNLGGAPATSGTPTTGGMNFGAPKPNTSGIQTGTAATTGGGLAGLSFGTPGIGTTPIASSASGFNITGAAQQTVPSTATGATPASSAAGGFNLSGAQTQVAQTTGSSFNLGGSATSTPAPAATGFNLGTPASSATFALGNAPPLTAAPAFNLGGTTAASSTPGFTLGKSTALPASTAAPTSVPQTSLGTATNVTSSSIATNQPSGLNFCQLEESINKWTLELEEQEKAFVNQATQVNAWDRLLIANGDKIVTLNQEVERVKLEQQQLEHELDYVVGQQRELQDCLVPLEKELGSVSAPDPEREYTYRLSENLDTQLKQMSEDLKEIIDHLNEANRSQDSSDPIVQIGKILNAHMNSLQWLDQRTAVLQTKIQQIDQLHQNFRQEHERSFNLAYN